MSDDVILKIGQPPETFRLVNIGPATLLGASSGGCPYQALYKTEDGEYIVYRAVVLPDENIVYVVETISISDLQPGGQFEYLGQISGLQNYRSLADGLNDSAELLAYARGETGPPSWLGLEGKEW